MLYPGAMFRGEIHASADAVNADAFGAVGDASLAEGHYPLWNPYLFAGMPTFGSGAYTRYLYPPSLVLTFLQDRLGFAPMTWLLAHLLFGGLGMAWLLTRWRLPTVLLILGAALWLLNPKVVAWAMNGHGSKLGAAMYLPWLVGWVWRVLDGRGARAVGMVGLLLGLLLLRGHPQITYYALLVCGWLVVFNAIWPLNSVAAEVSAAIRWRRAGLVVCGLVLGFLLAAVMLLPVYDYSEISIRGQDTAGGGGVGLDYATGWSLAPQELSTLVMPAAVGFGKATYFGRMPFNDYPNYFGVLWLALAAAAWWSGRRTLFIATVIMGVLAVLVALGGFGFGLYELLYRYLPFFNKFRIPSMILIVLAFGLALLAPLGLAAWRDGRYPGGRGLVLPALLAVVGAIMLASGGLNLARDSYLAGLANLAALDQRPAPQILLDEAWLLQRASLIRLGLLLLTAAAALWFSVRNERFRQGALPWVLLVLVVVDLLGVDRAITNPERHLQQVGRDSQGRGVLVAASKLGRKPADVPSRSGGPAAAEIKSAAGHDRIWPLGRFAGENVWMTDGIRSLGGYHAAKLASYEQIRRRLFSERPAAQLAAWLGGKVVITEQPLQEGARATLDHLGTSLAPDPVQAEGLWLYDNTAALPRARLVDRWRAVDALPQKDALTPFLDALQEGEVDYRTLVHLDRTPDPLPEPAAGPLPQPVFVTDGLDEIVLEVSTMRPAILVLADMVAPGWHAELDGSETTLLTADLVLRAVAVPAGEHTVRFHYRDPAVKAGLTVSIVGGVLILLLLLVPWLDRRRLRPRSTTGDAQADE